jgi:hypothetical protein
MRVVLMAFCARVPTDIVMWELLTRGEEPFADMTNVMEVALGIINQDLR